MSPPRHPCRQRARPPASNAATPGCHHATAPRKRAHCPPAAARTSAKRSPITGPVPAPAKAVQHSRRTEPPSPIGPRAPVATAVNPRSATAATRPLRQPYPMLQIRQRRGVKLLQAALQPPVGGEPHALAGPHAAHRPSGACLGQRQHPAMRYTPGLDGCSEHRPLPAMVQAGADGEGDGAGSRHAGSRHAGYPPSWVADVGPLVE